MNCLRYCRILTALQAFKIMKSFHTNTKATVQYDGNVSDPFTIQTRVKQGLVLASTLFGILFSILLKLPFCSSTIGVKLCTRSDGCLFNFGRLKAKREVKYTIVRDLLFVDDATLIAHSAHDMQKLMS